MALNAIHNETAFGVGDMIRVNQEITEGDKKRLQAFEGMVIGIKGRGIGKTITVRRMGSAQVGIEKIYPLALPSIKDISVVQKGKRGVKRAKLYYIRTKSRKEINKIFSRSTKREVAKTEAQKPTKKQVHDKLVKKNVKTKTKKSTKKPANASKK